jgi:hypothetical protein
MELTSSSDITDSEGEEERSDNEPPSVHDITDSEGEEEERPDNEPPSDHERDPDYNPNARDENSDTEMDVDNNEEEEVINTIFCLL